MSTARIARALVAGCAAVGAARCSPPPATAEEAGRFVAEARAATARYASRRQAIDDGFVRVGVEFPAMGEHWVSFARVLEDTLAAGRPSVLIYATVDGEPRLSGVGYTRLLEGRERVPRFPSTDAWHEHSGAVDEESLPLGHAHSAPPSRAAGGDDDAPRLFILHAWIWEPNPEGTFVTDNWALPLVRLGLDPDSVPPAATRGIALAADPDGYHRMVIGTALRLSEEEDSAAAAAIDRHRARGEAAVSAVAAARRLEPEMADALAGLWESLWEDLARTLPARAHELEQLRRRM